MAGAGRSNWDPFWRKTGITEDDFKVIEKTPLFASCSRTELVELLIDSAIQEFPRNTTLFMQRDPCKSFYVVIEGWVKVFRETVDGHESVLNVFGSGETFAEAAIFDTVGYPASAASCIDIRVLGIPSHNFKSRLAENDALNASFIKSVSNKLRLLTRQIEQLSARSATERLAAFLSTLCPKGAATTVVRLPVEKSVIAAKLGMQPETFSRSLSKLRTLGVRIDGDRIFIPDIIALRLLSDGETKPNMETCGI